jgi:demethylmenaquinone methyltransferase/2-methoxy-6-polyprenyl-1,4-benzoquinol methylase
MVAIDATAEPLALARLRPGTSNVRFLQADAYQLQTVSGEFDAAFAGLWFSHIPIEARQAFLAGLHNRLQPGARVLFIDNSLIQLCDFPIVQTDAAGNTYQLRQLQDGSTHRVLKNFPSEAELRTLLRPLATDVSYQLLDNFWLLEYQLSSDG